METKDLAEIKALEDRLSRAITLRDVNAIMANYDSSEALLVFDAIPPLQYKGAKAYRKDWEDALAATRGTIDCQVTDLNIRTDGAIGFSNCAVHFIVSGEGKETVFVFRATRGYEKKDGRWLIVHEHLSAPVDLATGKADFSGKR